MARLGSSVLMAPVVGEVARGPILEMEEEEEEEECEGSVVGWWWVELEGCGRDGVSCAVRLEVRWVGRGKKGEEW